MEANLVTLRGSSADPSKNLKAALEEASEIAESARAHLLTAQLAGLQDWDAADEIELAQRAFAALQRHLDFAHRLARRRNRLRQSAPASAGAA